MHSDHPPHRRARGLRVGALALAAAVIGAGGALAYDQVSGNDPTPIVTTVAAAQQTTPASLTSEAHDFSDVYAARANGVVSILAASGPQETDPTAPYPDEQRAPQGAAQGSGVVIDTEGHILTNEHVVSGATRVRVTFASGSTVDAQVVGTDPSTDLALIRVDVPAGSLSPVPLGDSSAVKIGEPVLAIGNPFGYTGSASAGIVSGLGRSIQSPNGFSVPDAIQTDAAVNHGNSGGALLNEAGELIGVPAQIADSGVNANVGVAFAIPSNTAKRVIAGLERGGSVAHAWLGVSTASVDQTLRGVDGISTDSGALVTGLAQNGPAAAAGLRLGERTASSMAGPVCTGGDIITAVDDQQVRDASGLQALIEAREPGANISLTVVGADGQTRTVPVTLAERPDSAPQTTMGCGG
ncbi:MAG TPA: trypsin-like peptidase domain-containing protein [Miltoncostaeaceae bacterium]|nr:trypsin-like peptidase domain-containing protein [Miltoncostaeaceae bacterium]